MTSWIDFIVAILSLFLNLKAEVVNSNSYVVAVVVVEVEQ